MLNLKKGERAALIGFTGIRLSEVEISNATKTTLEVIKKDGSTMVFDKKTGVQTNVAAGKEKYANKLLTLADSPAKKAEAPKKEEKKSTKKAPKKAEPEDDEEEEEEEAPKAPKKGTKKAPKKKAPEPDPDEEEDEDEYEEV